jgi:Viral A-type inclusion protein repeat
VSDAEIDKLKWHLEVALQEIDRLRAKVSALERQLALNGLLSV